ncbi:HNH endonuclease [Curtobacterium sp. MCBA15_001]|uniref:HNH endonuclease n=1 Tax=Curtobacterium sp. MCBA15_001 TaxID=1898731 RepID=UPI001587F15F
MRSALEAAQAGKCGWCESLLDERAVEVDHIRPKGRALYWWLAFELSNLLVACRSCNNLKWNRWPLVRGAARLTPRQNLPEATERSAVVDPTREDPQPHLQFVNLGGVWRYAALSPRGLETIRVLSLDRDRLSRKLSDHVNLIVAPRLAKLKAALDSEDFDEWTALRAEPSSLCGRESPYSAITKQLVVEAFL